jgi:hypothetical protein
MRQVLLLAALAIAILVGAANFLDEGEVVTLTTVADDLTRHETQLWVIDDGGIPYVRAGSANAQWYQRLRARPHVLLQRNGTVHPYVAIPVIDDETRARVNRAMALKYGLADEILGRLVPVGGSVPIRLEILVAMPSLDDAARSAATPKEPPIDPDAAGEGAPGADAATEAPASGETPEAAAPSPAAIDAATAAPPEAAGAAPGGNPATPD